MILPKIEKESIGASRKDMDRCTNIFSFSVPNFACDLFGKADCVSATDDRLMANAAGRSEMQNSPNIRQLRANEMAHRLPNSLCDADADRQLLAASELLRFKTKQWSR